MPKKKSHHKPKRKSRAHSHLDVGQHGHHARLRRHHHTITAHHSSGHDRTDGHHGKRGKKAGTRKHKPSALMKRLRAAAAGAREQLKNFGRRRKSQQPEKQVTEQTLRNHMALKCVRRCSH